MPAIFRSTEYDIGQLMDKIERNEIALPDIQRPFVWYKNLAKVRDLFDSLYKGFPIGYFLFWDNANRADYKNIGFEKNVLDIPRLLIIDGQQRLTALYAVMKNKEIITPDYEIKKIKIAFCPLDNTFKVGDAATDKNPEFIPNITTLWSGDRTEFEITKEFLENLKISKIIGVEDERMIQKNISNAINIEKYPVDALEIHDNIDEETVSNIFVRINSQGVPLTQADFVLTLLSVFWQEGRKDIEQFCMDSRKMPGENVRYSSFNHIIKPDPSDIVKIVVGVAFKRAKMKDAYSILHGKDLETEKFSVELREKQFDILKKYLLEVLDNTNWNSFLKVLISTGYKDEELVASKNAVLSAYIFYLLGKMEFKVNDFELQRAIGKWFFMSSLSARYSYSPESTLENDLNKTKECRNSEDFIAFIEKTIQDNLTNDFWNIELVNALETSSVRSPGANAFYASLNKLKAPILFSKKLVSDLYDPTLKIRKNRLEKHHIFPVNYLSKKYNFNANIDKAKINQVANMTFLEFEDNISISDEAPEKYYKKMQSRFDEKEFNKMFEYHALPKDFYNLEYDEFLQKRRQLMSQVIKKAFSKL